MLFVLQRGRGVFIIRSNEGLRGAVGAVVSQRRGNSPRRQGCFATVVLGGGAVPFAGRVGQGKLLYKYYKLNGAGAIYHERFCIWEGMAFQGKGDYKDWNLFRCSGVIHEEEKEIKNK